MTAALTETLPFHPLADLFPLIEGAEFDELVADVRAYGVREPIWIYQGKVLDGRNRHRAAQGAGVPCPVRTYDGDDPVGFVISLNLKRRHLSESQRAMVAAKLATFKLGDNQHSEGLPIGRASELLNVSERSAARAREVHEHGAPELAQAVERGDVSVAAAADIATRPPDEQREIVARGEAEILRIAGQIRVRKMEERRAERLAKVAALGQAGPLPRAQWPLILADPPWRFEFSPTGSRAIENHYPTMDLAEIAALPVGDIATADAVLFLWTPAAVLMQAREIITAWGFTYRTGSVWVKPDTGTGHYFRLLHEHLLLAARGDIPAPHFDARPDSVFHADRREHSQKPDAAYEIIERMYPDLPKIELFARSRRPGWDAWGNEAPPHPLDIPPCLRRAAP